MKNKIQVSNLKKSYNNKLILKGISFNVYEGCIFALLGANGAGKTTTLECIEGIKSYDNGEIFIDGEIGVQLQSSSLPKEIKGYEALELFSRWKNTCLDKDLIHSLGINNILKTQYKEMSTGQKRRLHLALALIGNPDIIFLDEPTAGLDVEGRIALHDEIRKLKALGKTIIMATHDMSEVEALCDKLAILKSGKIIFTGTINELKSNIKNIYKIMIKTSSQFPYEKLSFATYKGFLQDYYCFDVTKINDGLLELMTIAKNNNIIISDIQIDHKSLENCFIDMVKEDK